MVPVVAAREVAGVLLLVVVSGVLAIVRVAARPEFATLRDCTVPVVARGTTFPPVRAFVVVRSVTPGVRIAVVVARLRTLFVVETAPVVFVRGVVFVDFSRLDTVVFVDARRTAARATSPTSFAYAAYTPANARHPAKISPNLFILCT